MLEYSFLRWFIVIRACTQNGHSFIKWKMMKIINEVGSIVPAYTNNYGYAVPGFFVSKLYQVGFFPFRKHRCFAGCAECDEIFHSTLNYIINYFTQCIKVNCTPAIEGCDQRNTGTPQCFA